MKERAKRFLTSIVAALTLVSSVPAQAYASELEPDSSLVSPQDNGTTPDTGSDNAPVVENNTPDGGGTTDGNTATNVNTTNETTNNVTPTSTTSDTTTNVTPTADTTNGNSTPIDENDLGENDQDENDQDEDDQGENDLGGDDLGEADQDDWDMESEDALILSVEASTFSLRTAAAQEPTLLAEEDSSTEENQTATPVVTIGGKQLGSSEGDTSWSAGWNAGSETEKASGWRYDGTSVSMVNNGTAVNVHAEGTGVDFSMAGVNHIGTLYADGDVNITGTGILLIDEIDMLEGTKLNLLTNTAIYEDGSGSVAVFLLNKTSGEYVLVNGNVKGILDEEYTIPDGITLVVPKGGTLDMRVTATGNSSGVVNTVSSAGSESASSGSSGVTLEANGSVEGYETTATVATPTNTENTRATTTNAPYSSPVLNVAANTILKIQQGAQLLMESFQKTITMWQDYFNASTLNVWGKLLLDGSIQATKNTEDGSARNFYLNVKEGGTVQGSGTMTDVYVKYEENAGSDKDTLNIKSSITTASSQTSGTPSYSTSFVSVASSSKVNSLNAIGADNTINVIFADGASIGSISAVEGSSVSLYSESPYQQMNVGSIVGDYSVCSGYLSIGGNLVTHTFSNPTPAGNNPIPVEVYLGSISGSGAAPMIPGIDFVASFNTSVEPWESRGSYSGSISYDELYSALSSKLPDKQGDVLFEVYSVKDGKVTVSLFSSSHSPVVDRNSVFLIRAAITCIYGSQMGGSSITGTNTSNTGSGILGGQNAGSLAGGNANSVLGGNRVPPSNVEEDKTEDEENKNEESKDEESKDEESKDEENKDEENKDEENKDEDIKGDNNAGISDSLREPSVSIGDGITPATSAEPVRDVVVEAVSDSGDSYQLTILVDGVELKKLEGGTIPVTMEVTLQDGWNKNDLFVVFRGENGKLIAVKARYNPVTGMLMFDAPMLGKFQLVSFPWDGTDYESEAFLAALDDYLN